MDAFLLVYLISAIAKADGLGGAECLACLAAYAPITNVVNLGSFGAMPVSVVLVSAVLPAAIEPATFKSSGDAIAAEPTPINFLLLKF